MKRRVLFLCLSIILSFIFVSCYDIPAPEVQIWSTNPLGFSVCQFDYTFVDTQYTGGPYNINPDLYYVDLSGAYQDSAHHQYVWMVPHFHYWDVVSVDTVTFWVRNGVEAIVDGYYCEFYRGTGFGEENEFLYQSPKYSNIGLFLPTTSRREDTLKVHLYGWPIRVREAVKMMYSESMDTVWQSVQVRVHFYGRDAYGEDKEFEVTKDYMLVRTL